MSTDFRYQPAIIHQQELLRDAAARRLVRPDRMAGPDRPAATSTRFGWLLRRLVGPTAA
jgi:hypothetical protein